MGVFAALVAGAVPGASLFDANVQRAGSLMDTSAWQLTIIDEDEATARKLIRPTVDDWVARALYLRCTGLVASQLIERHDTVGEPARILACDGRG